VRWHCLLVPVLLFSLSLPGQQAAAAALPEQHIGWDVGPNASIIIITVVAITSSSIDKILS